MHYLWVLMAQELHYYFKILSSKFLFMAGRGDNNKSGSAGRGASRQSGQATGQAEKAGKQNNKDAKPGRTSNQGRKESSGGDLSKSSERGS